MQILLACLLVGLAVYVLASADRYQGVQGKWELIELRGKSGDQVLVKPAPPGTGFRIIGNWIKPFGVGSEEWRFGGLFFLHGNPVECCSEAHIIVFAYMGRPAPALLGFEDDKLLIAICGGGQHPKTLDLGNAPDGTRIWVLRRRRQ